jgi:methionine-rich copper-binding protein CopC
MKTFQSYSRRLVCLIPFLLGALVAGCGDGSDNTDNNSGGTNFGASPTVTSTTPADAAKDVPVNREITARFDKAMDDKSINATTFMLTAPGAVAVAGTVTLDAANNTATFKPASALAVNTLFTATITTGAKAASGIALASKVAWTFTTATADTTRPTITSSTPADGATGVATNRKITATFDEAMDSTSISASSFTLTGPGTTPVTGGVVSLADNTASFTPPASNLAASTVYTATIKAGVKDLAGNALLKDFVWRFTTADAAQALAKGPAPVVLGTAGNFVILAKAGVSTTGTTKIVGNIGLSPAAESFITGFSQARDATNVFSTAPTLVTGKLFAANMAVPTPSNLTTAVGNMETAYTDAAGRTLPDTTELGAGNISGMTLDPGLHKWGTGLLLASGVTLKGGANDVWIFQVAQDLTVGNGVILTLSGGAQARNIFWQVAGKTTLGTTSDFKGTILSKTLIALQTGAKLNGRTLAQTAVTLDANAVTQPAQ